MNKYVWIAYGMMWLSVALAISVGIYFTQNIHCLWFFLIPMMMKVKSGSGNEAESEDKE